MRVWIFKLMLFTLVIGNFSDRVYAAAPDHAFAHHQMYHSNAADNESYHSEEGQNQDESAWDDCDWVHSHLMVNLVTPTKISLNFNKQIIIASADHHHSIDLSGLKRPPRL